MSRKNANNNTDPAWTPSDSFSTKLLDLSGEDYNTCFRMPMRVPPNTKVYMRVCIYVYAADLLVALCVNMKGDLSLGNFIQFILQWRQVYQHYLYAYKPACVYMRVCVCVSCCPIAGEQPLRPVRLLGSDNPPKVIVFWWTLCRWATGRGLICKYIHTLTYKHTLTGII